MFVHAEVPKFRACVRAEYLYDMDPKRTGERVQCEVFGVSSYRGEALTVQAVLSDGSLFSYLPLTAIDSLGGGEPSPSLNLDDLSWGNCPSEEIAVTAFDFLRKTPVSCYFRTPRIWLAAAYLFTIDWYNDNEQLNVVELENGQFAAVPNHKAKFGHTERSLPPYKKLHATWRIGPERKSS